MVVNRFCLSRSVLMCSLALFGMSAQAATFNFDGIGKLEFNADAAVKGYHLNNGEDNNPLVLPEDKSGALTRVRLGINMYDETGWAIKTRFLGFYNWAGDRRHSGGSGTNYNDGINNDSLSLDEAYLEYSGINSWLFRVGRQEANWGYGFNITDDRRDRILAMKTMMLDSGYVGFLGIYDLRFAEDFSTASAGSKEFTGDLSMYSLAAIGNYKGLDWGILAAYFDGSEATDFMNEVSNPYYTHYFYNISPYFSKTIGDFSVKGAANIILSDANKDLPIYFWGNNSWSGFVEGGYQIVNSFQLQAQVAAMGDGGLVGRGWDSYSMLINSDPRNDINPVRSEFFGGFGNYNGNGGKDGVLFGMRGNWTPIEKLKLTFAVGHMDMDTYNADIFRDGIKSTFYDLNAVYEFKPGTTFELRAGYADGDINDTAVMSTIRVKFG